MIEIEAMYGLLVARSSHRVIAVGPMIRVAYGDAPHDFVVFAMRGKELITFQGSDELQLLPLSKPSPN